MLQWFCMGWIIGISLMGSHAWNLHISTWLVLVIFVLWQKLQSNFIPDVKQLFPLTLQLILNVLIGIVLGFGYATTQLDERLALIQHEQYEAELIVYLPEISQLKEQKLQQTIQVLNLSSQAQYFSASISTQILQEQQLKLEPGQYYRMWGRVKPSQSYATPGAFDIEKWNIQQNLHASFDVKQLEYLTEQQVASLGFNSDIRQHQAILHQFKIAIEKQRLRLREFIQKQPLRNNGLILALLTGDKSLLNKGTEQLFQRFGMSHLLAISGPHVLIFAILVCWCIRRSLAKWLPDLYLKWPQQYVLVLPFIMCVSLYCAFTGFDIPALRTLIICLVASAMLLLKQRIRPFALLIFSASILLLFDPFSILSAAFWLSYGACFILLRIYQTLQRKQMNAEQLTYAQSIKNALMILIESQWKIFIALFPLMIIFFKQIAWITPLSNLFAIPWLGFVVVPLDILAALAYFIFEPLSSALFQLNDLFIELLHVVLYGLDRIFSPALDAVAMKNTQILLLILALVIVFLPQGLMPKSWGWIGLIFVVLPIRNPVPFQLSVLDVGQGQSIFIRYHQHTMMVDFGGYYDESKFSIGKNIIQPFLSVNGVRKLDQVVLTHLDQDHSGGFFSIYEQLTIGQLYTNQQVEKIWAVPQVLCLQGQAWNWDNQVFFKVLSPSREQQEAIPFNTNESSCVLYVSVREKNGFKNFLLMGDAGWETEYKILQNYPNLSVDVLVLGHHGSQYSSAYTFLQHLEPKLAIASVGRFNRYGHPAMLTQSRLDKLGIPFLQTAKSGTIHFVEKGKDIKLLEERAKYKWYDYSTKSITAD